MKAYLILLAGGDGTRMGGGPSKTLIPLLGVPAITRAARAFVGQVCGVVLVCRPAERQTISALMPDGMPVLCADAGRDRQESVLHGLMALPDDCDTVLIHDGARALVTARLVTDILRSVAEHGTGVAATPVYDTVKRADDHLDVTETVSREGLYVIMTPQGFPRDLIERAHAACGDYRATDDAALVERLGTRVRLVPTGADNIKLTRPEDVTRTEALLRAREASRLLPRVGHGFDAHRLSETRKLVLCGVDIPSTRGLLGHSDADVAAHALMDALLGAAALGDIGQHFSDRDARYAGISSMTLLRQVCELLKTHGFAPAQADVTIVAQRPKLAGYIPDMRARLALEMGIPLENVSVKATTTEGMGFPGEGLGIAAHAVAVIMPLEN